MLAFLVAAQTFVADRADQMKSKMNDRGATAVEYGLLIALVAALIIGAVFLFGGNLRDLFTGVAEEIAAPDGQI